MAVFLPEGHIAVKGGLTASTARPCLCYPCGRCFHCVKPSRVQRGNGTALNFMSLPRSLLLYLFICFRGQNNSFSRYHFYDFLEVDSKLFILKLQVEG